MRTRLSLFRISILHMCQERHLGRVADCRRSDQPHDALLAPARPGLRMPQALGYKAHDRIGIVPSGCVENGRSTHNFYKLSLAKPHQCFSIALLTIWGCRGRSAPVMAKQVAPPRPHQLARMLPPSGEPGLAAVVAEPVRA